jgi:hypothetical protein
MMTAVNFFAWHVSELKLLIFLQIIYAFFYTNGFLFSIWNAYVNGLLHATWNTDIHDISTYLIGY